MTRRLVVLLSMLSLTVMASAADPPSASQSTALPQNLRQAELSHSAPQAGTLEPDLRTQRAHQKKTVATIRNIGTAMFSWLTDQVGAAAGRPRSSPPGTIRMTTASPEGQVVKMDDYPLISSARLREVFIPTYLAQLEETDGWGNALEFRLNVDEPLAKHVMCIRSPGRDGRFSGESYAVSPFDPDDFDQDIVWCDGFFVRWPQKPARPDNT